MTKIIFFIMALCIGISAQPKSELQNLVDTENSFARTAAEKGTKAAFLEFLADDGIVFNPTEINGKQVWQARPESPALLSWRPNWADISSDGKIGYTTGGWEFRPKGKADEPAGFGEYATVWKKQADGSYKAVLDLGISHSKPTGTKYGWSFPRDVESAPEIPQKAITLEQLTDIFSKKSLADAFFKYYADDVVVLRDDHMPFTGKTTAFIGIEKMDKDFPARSVLKFDGKISPLYGNMVYAYGVYQLTNEDQSVKRWNFMQVWKYRGGRWQIVLDVFKKIPEK